MMDTRQTLAIVPERMQAFAWEMVRTPAPEQHVDPTAFSGEATTHCLAASLPRSPSLRPREPVLLCAQKKSDILCWEEAHPDRDSHLGPRQPELARRRGTQTRAQRQIPIRTGTGRKQPFMIVIAVALLGCRGSALRDHSLRGRSMAGCSSQTDSGLGFASLLPASERPA